MVIGKLAILLSLISVLISVSSRAVCQTTVTLRTRNVVLALQAGRDAPKVVSFGSNAEKRWRNIASEKLIDSVLLEGRPVQVQWRLNERESEGNTTRVSFVYESDMPKLRLAWEWKAPDGGGPLEHATHIQNLENREIWIPMQDSIVLELAISPAVTLRHFYVEKGAGKPSSEGTHLSGVPVGYRWAGESSTYAHPAEGAPREIIPFLAIEETMGQKEGWYTGIEFSGRTRLMLERDPKHLRASLGLNPDPGPFRSRLKPRDIFDTPTVFVGSFIGDVDSLGNQLRPWVRQVLGHPKAWADPKYPLLVNNSWGSGMQVDEGLALKMIRDSAELGLEMFHMDAGWFRGVGDWYPDPKKFPHGLAAIADNAHRHNLRFGAWVDWTQAALDAEPGALNLRDPKVRDWTISDVPANWKPEPFKGQTIDIGDGAAHDYAKREVTRIVDEYHLDMLEHDGYLVAQGCVRSDHPHAPPDPSQMSTTKIDGSYFVLSSNSTDVSYHAVRAYYDIYSDLRRRHPNLLLEVCNDGGRMVDFGSAAHGDYFSITDTYDPVSNRRAFYDASHLFPAAMLESYIEKWPTPSIENFRYMLRSGMQGWLTIMLDTNAWTGAERAVAKGEIQLYKDELRRLIREGDIYHVAPRPDGIHWDGTEFFDERRARGVVYAFRGSGENEREYNYRLKGLAPGERYRLHFEDGTAPDRLASGKELLSHGVTVKLAAPNSSELIFIRPEGREHR